MLISASPQSHDQPGLKSTMTRRQPSSNRSTHMVRILSTRSVRIRS